MAGRHEQYGDFIANGDAEGFREESEALRERLRREWVGGQGGLPALPPAYRFSCCGMPSTW